MESLAIGITIPAHTPASLRHAEALRKSAKAETNPSLYVSRNEAFSSVKRMSTDERELPCPPGGFEQIAYQVQGTPADRINDLAPQFGCEILGPPVA